MKCRACDSENLFSAINLGILPIAGYFVQNETDAAPLLKTEMLVCEDCGIGMLSEDFSEDEMFRYYNFRTSVSKSYLQYAKEYCDMVVDKYNISNDDWVLEIASNDGYLLKYFKEKNIGILGVDPARNIIFDALCDGIPTVNNFFNLTMAKKIKYRKKCPKLIVANNVMAHVPNIQDFMAGIAMLCSDDTVVSIENPTIINILEKDHFDTIFHEHFSYLSATAVDKLANKYGLKLFHVESVPVHGGSNRYWLSKTKEKQESVDIFIKNEANSRLTDSEQWKNSFLRIQKNVIKFKNRVQNINKNNGVVCGYTASAKSTVLLNFAGIQNGQIVAIADDVKEKQNHFIPGPMIPITDIQTMLSYNPTDVIVFSWNIYEDIKQKIIDAGYPNINVWVWNE